MRLESCLPQFPTSPTFTLKRASTTAALSVYAFWTRSSQTLTAWVSLWSAALSKPKHFSKQGVRVKMWFFFQSNEQFKFPEIRNQIRSRDETKKAWCVVRVQFKASFPWLDLNQSPHLYVTSHLVPPQLLDEPQFRCITKIKTIGSTYMAASGVTPDINDYTCMKVSKLQQCCCFKVFSPITCVESAGLCPSWWLWRAQFAVRFFFFFTLSYLNMTGCFLFVSS